MNKDLIASYRVVNPSPTSSFLEARELVINSIIVEILTQQNYKLLLKYVKGSLVGYKNNDDIAEITNLSSLLKRHESNFPKDLTDNSLELQVLSAISVGEIFSKFLNNEEVFEQFEEEEEIETDDEYEEEESELEEGEEESEVEEEGESEIEAEEDEPVNLMKDNIVFAASIFLISGSNLRVATQPRYLALLKKKLDELASDTIERKTRVLEILGKTDGVSKSTIEVLSALHGDLSKSLNIPFSKLNVFDAAFTSAKEIAASGNVIPNTEKLQWISQAIKKNRKNKDLKDKKLFSILESFTDITLSSFSSLESQKTTLINNFPSVFPISWAYIKLVNEESLSDFKHEFERETLLSLEDVYSPEIIGKQIFFEMIAQNIYTKTYGEYL